MTFSLAQDAIALLIELAQRGEINPWDVQVIEVIDRYLSTLAPVSDAGQPQREAALSQSGQAFLYASMLVLLKADTLARSDSEDSEPNLQDAELLAETGEDFNTQLPLRLERQLRRRAVAPTQKKRRVTLPELIEQLQLMAKATEERQNRPRRRRSTPQSRSQTARAIAELAHQENLTEMAGELEKFLAHHWPQISEDQDWMELDELLEKWPLSKRTATPMAHPPSDPTSEATKVGDRVAVFWALLLLSAQSKVELAQEEFYQDLKIRAISESVAVSC